MSQTVGISQARAMCDMFIGTVMPCLLYLQHWSFDPQVLQMAPNWPIICPLKISWLRSFDWLMDLSLAIKPSSSPIFPFCGPSSHLIDNGSSFPTAWIKCSYNSRIPAGDAGTEYKPKHHHRNGHRFWKDTYRHSPNQIRGWTRIK